MLYLNYKKMLLSAIMITAPLAFAGSNFFNKSESQELEQNLMRTNDCNKLCIPKIITRCLKAKAIKAACVEADELKANSLCAPSINANNICAQNINITEHLSLPMLSTASVCTNQLNAMNLCVSGMLKANSIQQCSVYTASVAYDPGLTNYILNDYLNFETILEDPNGDCTSNPTEYTAPLAGYYLLAIQVDQQDLQGNDMILGVPIGNIEIYINGVKSRENFTPFLTFHNVQKSSYSTHFTLKAGDVISCKYNVFVMTDMGGFQPYVGTVNIIGTGSEANGSLLKIHYLSSSCADASECLPCQVIPFQSVCDLPCMSCAEACADCDTD